MKIYLEIDKSKCIVEQDGITLDDALYLFEQALRGCGFAFDGRLEVVNED